MAILEVFFYLEVPHPPSFLFMNPEAAPGKPSLLSSRLFLLAISDR